MPSGVDPSAYLLYYICSRATECITITGVTMQYGKIEGLEKPVSKIICGTASAPFNGGKDCTALLEGIFALGVNTFDTARVYGGAERTLGRWLQNSGRRNGAVIISKCCHPDIFGRKRVNVRAMRADLGRTLRMLCTDYADVYLLHRDDRGVPVGPLVEEFNAMHAAGKVRAFGGSNWSHERVEEANEYAYAHGLVPFTVTSPNFSLAEQVGDLWGGGVSISGAAGADARAYYAQRGVAVVAYSSLACGLLSGKVVPDGSNALKVLDKFAVKGYYSKENLACLERCAKVANNRGASVAQVALAYVLCSGMNAFAVVSCSSAARMQQNCVAAEISLSAEDVAFLEGVQSR